MSPAKARRTPATVLNIAKLIMRELCLGDYVLLLIRSKECENDISRERRVYKTEHRIERGTDLPIVSFITST